MNALKETTEETVSGFLSTCTGANKLVDKWVDEYLNSYHPLGYGTYVKDSKPLTSEMKQVTMWRAKSCD